MIFLVKEMYPTELRSKPTKLGQGFSFSGISRSLKALGVSFLIFLGAILIYRAGYTMIDPFFSIYLRDVLRLDISSTSYIFALRAMCTLIFAPLGGWLADKWGRKPTFILSIALTVIALISYTRIKNTSDIYLVGVLTL